MICLPVRCKRLALIAHSYHIVTNGCCLAGPLLVA